MKMQLKPLKCFVPATIVVVLIFLTTANICRGHVNDFDIIIRGGQIVDGTGSEAYRTDIGIKDGRIVEIGKLQDGKSGRIINAEGMTAAPGFIDIHTHTDHDILKNPSAENYIRQGVTTVVGGNCGGSPYPIGGFLKRVSSRGIALNFALLAGHNTIRREIMGMENRPLVIGELEKMKALLERAMKEGAFGLSTGLKYVPGAYASTDEVVELAKVAAKYGGFYATHMRDEGRGLIKAVREAIEIAKRAKIGVQISHHKLVGKSMWNSSIKTLEMVDKAIDDGLDITLDQYPYTATSTNLTVLFPSWALEGGQNRLKERLNNPRLRQKIKETVVDNILFDRGGGDASRIVIVSCSAEGDLEGKSIAEITRMHGKQPTAENAAETIMDLQYAGAASAIYHCLCEYDVEQIMKHPLVMHASDGSAVTFGQAKPHPRNYGTFPRVLARYVREKKMISLPEAVRKMTSLPASRLKLKDRGVLKKGMAADIVVFEPKSVADKATWQNPHQYAEGIPYVLVNGQLVIDDNERTEAFPGKVLYGPGKK